MEKLNQLNQQLIELDKKLDALVAQDNLTKEQLAEHDKLVAERKSLQAAIDRQKAVLARADERAALAAEIQAAEAAAARSSRQGEMAGRNRISNPDTPTSAGPPAVAVADERIPATVRRYSSLRNFRDTRRGRTAEERAFRFGTWALAQLTHQLPHRYRFTDAVNWVNKHMVAHQTNNVTGAYNLVPEEFGTDLIDLREMYGVARRLFKMVPMASDTRTDPRRTGGLTAYFVSEGSAGTESNKTWDSVRLTAKDLMVVARMSAQVNADAVINFGDDLVGEASYALSNKEDDCSFNGDATSTYGHITGVRTKLQDVDLAGTDSFGLVTGTGNLWSELTLNDHIAVIAKLPQYADTPNCVWVCHKTYFHNVMQKLELAAGGVTARETAEGERRPRPTFLGYPVEFSQVWPSTEANSQVCVALGDFSLGASFGDRQSDEIAFSEHATIGGENVFERNQIAVRCTERFDVNVHDVGSSSASGPIVGLQTAAS